MTQAEILVLIATLGRDMYRRTVMQRMVSGTVKVAVLAIFAALVAGASLVTTLYAVQLHFGMESPMTILNVSLIGWLVTAIFIAIIVVHARRLKRKESPPEIYVREMADAFLQGLLEP